MEPTIWLDEYKGTCWMYAPKFRPPSPGFTVPKKGYLTRLRSSAAAIREGCPHGVIYYSRELDPSECENYELKPLGTIVQ